MSPINNVVLKGVPWINILLKGVINLAMALITSMHYKRMVKIQAVVTYVTKLKYKTVTSKMSTSVTKAKTHSLTD